MSSTWSEGTIDKVRVGRVVRCVYQWRSMKAMKGIPLRRLIRGEPKCEIKGPLSLDVHRCMVRRTGIAGLLGIGRL